MPVYPVMALRDEAPDGPLTNYDLAQAKTYLRLLDADAVDADWHEVARIVLELDPVADPERAHAVWASHLKRAKWMTTTGYRYLLQGGVPH